MVMTCVVYGCKESCVPGNFIQFHRFPKNETKKKEWELKISNEYVKAGITISFVATMNSRICSKHFLKEDYKENALGRNRLIPNAIPSVFELKKHNQSQSSIVIPNHELQSVNTKIMEQTPSSFEYGLHTRNEENCQIVIPNTESDLKVQLVDIDKEIKDVTNMIKKLSDVKEYLMCKKLTIEDKLKKSFQMSESKENIEPVDSNVEPGLLYKKRRLCYVGDFNENDVESPTKMKKFMTVANEQLFHYQKRLKKLRNDNLYLKKKISTMNEIISDLESKLLITDTASSLLKISATPSAEAIFQRMREGKCREKYPAELKAFALTLHFYSPKAYDYVRSSFANFLPHTDTIRKWYQNIEGSPGFTSEAFSALKIKAHEASKRNESVKCALIVDEMCIKKHIEWDGKKFSGYTDLGTNLDDDMLSPAKEALTFMLNAINGKWKVPIGYFLINGLSGEERANLIKTALSLIHETGVDVVSITCDGTPTNFAMMNKLGANLDPDNLITYFKHPVTSNPVYVLLDPCHMLKLIRNAFASLRVLMDQSGNFIKWNYITQLHEKQKSEGLYISKVGTRHVQWFREKMKVKLAAQTLSCRVADALLYLKYDLKMPEFADCDGTSTFTRNFNDLFDILNSRNLLSKGFKSPIKTGNKDIYMKFFDEVESYIRGLKTFDETGSTVPILKSNRKTGFLGMIICMKSFRSLYHKLCENSNSNMNFLLTYKFSQDHLETFFSAIRSKGGFNNNPTARQFKAAYVRLLAHHEIMTSDSANCLILDETRVLNVSSAKNVFIETINGNCGNIEEMDDFDNFESVQHDHDYANGALHVTKLSCYVNDVVEYIAGFVVKKLQASLHCDECSLALVQNNEQYKLIKRKNRGGLIVPSDCVVNICKKAETSFKIAQAVGKLKKKNVLGLLYAHTYRSLVTSEFFSELKEHCTDQAPLDNHIGILIKAVLFEYFKIRLYHSGKIETETLQKDKVRSINLKVTLNKGH